MEQEEKNVAKPRKIWDNALRAVKGENTMQVVENFTAEMTLVAEGLCEDHGRLRKAVEDMESEQDRLMRDAVEFIRGVLAEASRKAARGAGSTP